MSPPEGGDDTRQSGRSRGLHRAEAQKPLGLISTAYRVTGLVGEAQQLLGIAGQQGAGGGDHQAPVDPVEQGGAQVLLKLAQTGGDVGLDREGVRQRG